MGGTVDERIAMVSELSRMAWATSGRPRPAYSRDQMPITRARLGERRDRD
jgi:hypothetical protein